MRAMRQVLPRWNSGRRPELWTVGARLGKQKATDQRPANNACFQPYFASRIASCALPRFAGRDAMQARFWRGRMIVALTARILSRRAMTCCSDSARFGWPPG